MPMEEIMKKEGLYGLDYLRQAFNGEVEEILDMIDMYISLVPSSIAGMQEAFANEDLKKVKKLAHKLKTTFMLFESYEALELAKSIEGERGVSPGQVKEKIDRLAEIVLDTVKNLKVDKSNLRENINKIHER